MAEGFNIESERMMPLGINILALCPSMDLVALVTSDNSLQVYRISYKTELILSTKPKVSSSITQCVFSPDGKLVAYALQNGQLRIVKTISNSFFEIILGNWHDSVISRVNWFSVSGVEVKKPFREELGSFIQGVTAHAYADK